MEHQMQLKGVSAITPTALSIALEHPELSTEPCILCAAARACKAWREAVQQCKACNTAVQLRLAAPLSQLCNFSRWLPKHAALVKSLAISAPGNPHSVGGLPWELHLEAALQLLQQALQLTTAVPMAAAAAAARFAGQNTAAVHQPQQQPQQQQQAVQVPMGQLQGGFSSITMAGTVGMLAALPAHSLTHLHLEKLYAPFDGLAVSAALARLSSLQELRLSDADAVSPDCLAALVQLKQLTSLDLGKIDTFMKAEELQQLLAQPLPLRVLRLHYSGWASCLDLSRWTQLQEFIFSSSYRDGELDAAFPAQLQKLQAGTMQCEADFQPILPLQQLRSLVLIDEVGHPDLLLRLAQLPALQHLSLRYYYFDAAADAAAIWPQMPQLQELEMYPIYRSPSRGQWEDIRSGLAACTSLTKLQLNVAVEPDAEEELQLDAEDQRLFEAVEVCGKLAGLTNLRDLCLGSSYLVPGDALALTALTGLTRLELRLVNAGVGDLAATAIAGSCQQLRHLDLRSCHLGSMACLAAVRHLTQLTELHLEGNSGLTPQALMLLTRLKRLQHLGVDRSEQVTDQVVQRFWALVRQQQQQQQQQQQL